VHIDEFDSYFFASDPSLEISVLIPAYDEGENISTLISGVKKVLDKNKIAFEIMVVDAGSKDDTRERAKEAGAKVFVQNQPGYGRALKEGFEKAKGKYVITMDADLSHDPLFIDEMIQIYRDTDVIIASRYIPGGSADMSAFRRLLSIILNRMFCFILSLPYRDISSGYRCYNRKVMEQLIITSHNFDVLEEILIKAHQQGFRIVEVPFHYKPRVHGKSHVKLFHFGISFSKTLWKMWRLRRNSRYTQRSTRD
jgi:dolichol-phosphate mannosyltransferase